jgi:hypothetical protein
MQNCGSTVRATSKMNVYKNYNYTNQVAHEKNAGRWPNPVETLRTPEKKCIIARIQDLPSFLFWRVQFQPSGQVAASHEAF